MSIPIGTKMLTKPPKQKSKTHLINHTFKTSRLHDMHIVMNKGEINTGESNENENVYEFNELVVSKNCCFKVKFVPF